MNNSKVDVCAVGFFWCFSFAILVAKKLKFYTKHSLSTKNDDENLFEKSFKKLRIEIDRMS